MKNEFDIVIVSGAGIDTNVYLHGNDVDFGVEANFSENIDYVGQAGGYCSRGFAQLGKRTALIDYIGDDPLGRFIREELTRDGINMDAVFVEPEGTRRSINFMYSDGRRKNFYDGKGSMSIRPDISSCRNILEKTRLAHFNIINFSRYLLPVAKELGITISCDLQDVVTPDDPYRSEYVQYADVLFFSAVNHEDPTPLIRGFLESKQERIVLVGRGDKGCALGTKEGVRFFEPVRMSEPVVDTNGAGDGLAVGFLSSYFMDGYSIEESVLRAQIVARYTCTIKASSSHLITKKKLDEYFARLKPDAALSRS